MPCPNCKDNAVYQDSHLVYPRCGCPVDLCPYDQLIHIVQRLEHELAFMQGRFAHPIQTIINPSAMYDQLQSEHSNPHRTA